MLSISMPASSNVLLLLHILHHRHYKQAQLTQSSNTTSTMQSCYRRKLRCFSQSVLSELYTTAYLLPSIQKMKPQCCGHVPRADCVLHVCTDGTRRCARPRTSELWTEDIKHCTDSQYLYVSKLLRTDDDEC